MVHHGRGRGEGELYPYRKGTQGQHGGKGDAGMDRPRSTQGLSLWGIGAGEQPRPQPKGRRGKLPPLGVQSASRPPRGSSITWGGCAEQHGAGNPECPRAGRGAGAYDNRSRGYGGHWQAALRFSMVF